MIQFPGASFFLAMSRSWKQCSRSVPRLPQLLRSLLSLLLTSIILHGLLRHTVQYHLVL